VNEIVSLSPLERFNGLMVGLYNRVRTRATNPWRPATSDELTAIKEIWRRLRRMSRRFAAIMAQYKAGTLKPPGTAAPRAARPAAGPARWIYPSKPFGWVIHAISYFVWNEHHELVEMLDDPELEKMVAAAPQLGGELRPLCRMLAVKPPQWLVLPRRPRPSRAVVHEPPPDWLVAEPGAIVKPDGTVWMRFGASRSWTKPGSLWDTLEEAQKFDRPIKIWPRKD
jgi:hypothetical protein